MRGVSLFLITLLITTHFSLITKPVEAAGASLYFSPASGSFFVGSTFNISIFVNTGGQDVNAVQVDLKFPPDKLQITSPTAGRSFITVWIDQPVYSNVEGTASFKGGVPHPGINTTNGLVSTITFRAKTPGQAILKFRSSSKVLLDDGQGTDVLTSLGQGIYELTIAPPAGPEVFSPTHPDKNIWYKNNNVTLHWEKEEGLTDFSYSLDDDPNGVPDDISEGSATAKSFSEVPDGINYFHLKAKKAEIWGGVSHYPLMIDTTPPANFTPEVKPGLKTKETQPTISFFTTDGLSGIDHYEIKIIDLSSQAAAQSAFFVEQSSPYRLPQLAEGSYEVVVRAYDRAGNWTDATVKLEIVPAKFIILTNEGIQIKDTTIAWWLVYLILFVLITAVMILILFYWRKHRTLRAQIESNIQETHEKLMTNYTKVKQRMQEDIELKQAIEQEVKKMEDIRP